MDRGTILGGLFAIVLTGGIMSFVFLSNKEDKESTVGPSKELAGAIVANDPTAAPDDTEDYVKGVRGYFGRVKSARYLDTHTVRIGSGNQATTHPVTELLLRTRRGAAVLELEFGRGGPSEDYTIRDIAELKPDDVRSDLDDRSERAVERGFARRGRRAARPLALDGTFTDDRPSARKRRRVPKPPNPEQVARERRKSLDRLECVKRANQDIEKLKKC